jgi:hypothetical protein
MSGKNPMSGCAEAEIARSADNKRLRLFFGSFFSQVSGPQESPIDSRVGFHRRNSELELLGAAACALYLPHIRKEINIRQVGCVGHTGCA